MRRSRHGAKRGAARLITAVVLGTVTSIAIALGSAVSKSLGWSQPNLEGWVDERPATLWSLFRGRTWSWTEVLVGSVSLPEDERLGELLHPPFLFRREVVPRWVEWPRAGSGEAVRTNAFGWPLRCLKYSLLNRSADMSDVPTVQGGVTVIAATARKRALLLPISPIVLGLAVDAFGFGGAYGMLLFGPGAMRRLLRRRRGHCPRCNYDLMSDFSTGCPECGWGRPMNGSSPKAWVSI